MELRKRIARDVFYLESLPRLAFTDNMYSIMNTVFQLGLKGRYSTSAHYYQGIESLLENALSKGYKYGLTIDYDTWFTEHHVIDLYEIMEAHPDLLATFPLQPRRGHVYPMAGTFVDPDGDEIKIIKGDFVDGICEADTGHFGLTIIRLDLLKKLKKPWFRSQPAANPEADGSWGDKKKDADVYFWIKCKKEGFKVACAEVYIGHLQLLCSFTGTKEKNFKTQYVPIQAIHESHMPGWVQPNSSIREREKNENRTNTRESRRDGSSNGKKHKSQAAGSGQKISGRPNKTKAANRPKSGAK